MVNIDDFIKRLELILDYYNLSASAFADKIGVQRSSLSHLLSGRNKPSLDFILKVIEIFPEVDLYWVLNGKGKFPKSEIKSSIVEQTISTPKEDPILQKDSAVDLFSTAVHNTAEGQTKPVEYSQNTAIVSNDDDNIERIVIFYKDGTFRNYKP